jgi:two-component system OmpR family response regulator
MGNKVLFVDDDEHWREIVAIALKEAGFEVSTAQDASEALLQAEAVGPDLLILDLNLAGESGLTLMKYLKRNYPAVPILLYTSTDHDEAAILAMLKEGADQYLPKGSMEELIVTVGSYLR